MFSIEECIEILNHETLTICEGVIINCNTNMIEIPSHEINIELNEAQKRLLVCLAKKICTKRDIINIVWYETHQRISDNNYHQLTFQLRALFQRYNLPENLIITVPYYGLKLNDSQWKMLITEKTPTKKQESVSAEPLQSEEQKITVKSRTSVYAENNHDHASPQKQVSNYNLLQSSLMLNALMIVILIAIIFMR